MNSATAHGNCPYCRKPLGKDDKVCPNCKAAVPESKPKPKSTTKEKS